MGGLDGAHRNSLDVAQLLGDGRLDRLLERRLRGRRKVRRALGNDRGNRFARAVGSVRSGLAHLDHRGDQRRAGLVG